MPWSSCKSNAHSLFYNLNWYKKEQMWIKGFIYYLYTIENNQTYPIVDLEFIKNKSIELEAENHQFQDFLRNLDSLSLDKAVFDLSEAISPKIECTDCGNCCKSLMVNFTQWNSTTIVTNGYCFILN
jgi:hypothetical protein